jgi:hypothetical protein
VNVLAANPDRKVGGCEPSSPHPRPWRVGFAIVLLALIPLVAHGCHGKDEDHEPSVTPPVQSEARNEAAS